MFWILLCRISTLTLQPNSCSWFWRGNFIHQRFSIAKKTTLTIWSAQLWKMVRNLKFQFYQNFSYRMAHLFLSAQSRITCILTRNGLFSFNFNSFNFFSIRNSSDIGFVFPVLNYVNQSPKLIHCLMASCFFGPKTFLNPINRWEDFWPEEQKGYKLEIFSTITNLSWTPTWIKCFSQSIMQLFKGRNHIYKLDLKWQSLQLLLSSVSYQNGASL